MPRAWSSQSSRRGISGCWQGLPGRWMNRLDRASANSEEQARRDAVRHNEVIWRSVYSQSSIGSLSVGQKMLLRHVLILGSTGSGKTNHAFQIIKEAFG